MSAKSPKPTTTTKTAIGSPKSAKTAPASPVKRTASEITDVKPKKAAIPYMIWLNEVGRKEIVAKQFGGKSSDVKNILKAAGVAWKAMSDDDKKQWNEKAEKDKLRFAKEMESYVPSESSGPAKKKGKKGKKEKDPNKPKRAMSAYFFYMNEVRPEILRVNLGGDSKRWIKEGSKIVGENWAKMDAKAKEKYEQLAAKDKERAAKEMEEYKKNGGGADDDDDEEDEE